MRHGWAGTSLLQMWRPLDGVGTERRSAGLNVYIAAGCPRRYTPRAGPRLDRLRRARRSL